MSSRLHLDTSPVQIPGSNIWVCQIVLTVKLALDWLEKYNLKNRNPRKGKVAQQAADIESGRWILTHQGIAFDENGEMISGQHRCHAVVKSNKSIVTLVFINCSPDERKAIDQGSGRNVRDVAKLGCDDEGVNSFMVAAARAMYNGFELKKTTMTIQETYDLIITHRKALDFVLSCVTRKVPGVISASVMGAICRAYYHLKRQDVKRFVEVLVSGLSTVDEDRVIILLRNLLLEKQASLRDWQGRLTSYRLCETALEAYRCRTEVSKLVACKIEYFPLPATK